MNPATINTILNTAPVVLQGANKLIRMIRERGEESAARDQSVPDTIEGLKQEIEQIQTRLDSNDESDVEQIQLIEQLAKQNEALAESLHRASRYLTALTVISLVALVAAAGALTAIFYS